MTILEKHGGISVQKSSLISGLHYVLYVFYRRYHKDNPNQQLLITAGSVPSNSANPFLNDNDLMFSPGMLLICHSAASVKMLSFCESKSGEIENLPIWNLYILACTILCVIVALTLIYIGGFPMNNQR